MKRTFKNQLYMIKFCIKEMPRSFWFHVIACMEVELFIFFEYTIWLSFNLDAAENGTPFEKVLYVSIGVFILFLLHQLFDSIYFHWAFDRMKPVLTQKLRGKIYEKAKVYVVPTKSIGAGYVAMSSMSFDMSEPEGLMEEAQEAIARVTSAYISPAVRDADMNGVHVTEGDTMGIIAKEIVISGPDKMASTYGLIDILLAGGDKFMITIFYGKDASIEERDRLAEYMLETYPLVEAYYVDGGQEIYPFLFVAE